MKDLVNEGRHLQDNFKEKLAKEDSMVGSVVDKTTEMFPKEVIGNDQILFKKEWEKINGGKVSAKYKLYYKGYDIDPGGRIFGSVAELESFMKDYILSISVYNKYKNMPEKKVN